MKLLLISATAAEIQPLLLHLQAEARQINAQHFHHGQHTIRICVAGVGSVATTYELTRLLTQDTYDFVLQAGIAGSFDSKINIGEVVLVESEQHGDLGAENNAEYLDVFDMGLIDRNGHPYVDGTLPIWQHYLHSIMTLRKVKGISVNMASGNMATIRHRAARYGCQIESMEGAAFHYVCLRMHHSFAQVRAISNFVTPRNKEQWRIKEAIINLNEWLITFFRLL